jgi:hypothetical protein
VAWSYCLTYANILLTLALHHTPMVLQHRSPFHHPLEVLKISSLQSICQSIIQVIQETLLLCLISVHFMRSIVRQLSELGDILIHRHGPLLQILKLLLQLDHSLGDMVCMESRSKFWLVDTLGFLMAHKHPTSWLQDQRVDERLAAPSHNCCIAPLATSSLWT